MFESTLEAAGLHEGERRLGTLSAAALAHVAAGLAILAGTAFIVPKVQPPEAPLVVIIPPPLPKTDDWRPPVPQQHAGRKPGGPAIGAPPIAPPEVPARVSPPVATPDRLPERPDDDQATGAPGPTGGGGPGPGGLGVGDDATGVGDDDTSGSGPVYMTAEMERPVLLEKVEPVYPEVARRAGLRGRVTIQAVIGIDGAIESAQVLASKNPMFDDAALSAVTKWRYRPALMNGKPVRVYFTVVVDFVIR